MGEVVRLRKGHARASAISPRSSAARACINASASNVTPLMSRRRATSTKGSQYSGGMRPRCAHLLIAEAEMSCPADLKSADADSRVGHLSKTARGSANMTDSLGPFVLNCKANMSYDFEGAFDHPPAMSERMTESEEKAAFIGRVRAARMARFEKQKPICIILGLDQGTYKQYETRTPLPWRFIPKFCAATGIEMEWLLTGEGQGPNTVPLPRPARRRTATRQDKRQVA